MGNSISRATFKFLKDLQKNNNREWFAEHKPRYIAAQDEVKAFAAELAELMDEHDHIETPKVFRIYRDVRFSKNKIPYKSNIGVGLTRATDALRGGMYLNIEPGNTFAGGGFWAPNSADLKRIRNEFQVNADEFRNVLKGKKFRQLFEGVSGEALKTAPRGYPKDDPEIELLRMKQFLCTRRFTDAEAQSETFVAQVNETFKAMRPFFDFMSLVLTTNENGESLV